MVICDRLRFLREKKNLSQGDIEQRTGLLRCYISRVENGHTVPAIETLEKLARALEVPMYQLFYDGEKPPDATPFTNGKDEKLFGKTHEERKYMRKISRKLPHMTKKNRDLLLLIANKMSLMDAH